LTGTRVKAAISGLAMLAMVPALAAREPQPPPPAAWPEPVNDNAMLGSVRFDRLERTWGNNGEDTLTWDAKAWYGGDYNRLWLKTEGENRIGSAGGEMEAELLYGRLVTPFWEFQAGLSYERLYGTGPDHDRASAVIGFQGLAPYWFEIDTSLRASEDGDISAVLEAEYEVLLTQRLILQPRLETAFAASEVKQFGVGQGFNFVQSGLRLRYEIRREIAPYIGVSWTRKLGDTADLARDEGEDTSNVSLVAGVRFWF
jgi:copper resistance protein B